METMEIELREKIALLEEENLQLRKAILPLDDPFVRLDITSQQRALLNAIFRNDIATHEYLALVLVEWSNRELGEDPHVDMQLRIKVALCKLRQRLKKHGVKINTVHSVGYFMDDKSKDRLREIISG